MSQTNVFESHLLTNIHQISIQVLITLVESNSTHIAIERHGEQDLIKLEKEVNERQEIYLRAQPVFDKLDEWLGCWKEKLDIQRKVCRASFYNTRFTLNLFIKSYSNSFLLELC